MALAAVKGVDLEAVCFLGQIPMADYEKTLADPGVWAWKLCMCFQVAWSDNVNANTELRTSTPLGLIPSEPEQLGLPALS